MTTFLQTINIDFPNSDLLFHGLEPAPICPPSYKPENNNNFIVMKTIDKSIITWWKNGSIIKVTPDGTIKTWFPKLTLAEAIKMALSPYNKELYIQFHADSTVTCKFPDGNYYWSASIKGTPELGEQLFGYDYDEDGPENDDIVPPKCYECYERSK